MPPDGGVRPPVPEHDAVRDLLAEGIQTRLLDIELRCIHDVILGVIGRAEEPSENLWNLRKEKGRKGARRGRTKRGQRCNSDKNQHQVTTRQRSRCSS